MTEPTKGEDPLKDEGPLDWEGRCDKCGALVTFYSPYCGMLPTEFDKRGRHATHTWLVCELRMALLEARGVPLPASSDAREELLAPPEPSRASVLLDPLPGEGFAPPPDPQALGVWFLGDYYEKPGWCSEAGNQGPVSREVCEDWLLQEISPTNRRYRHLYEIRPWKRSA